MSFNYSMGTIVRAVLAMITTTSTAAAAAAPNGVDVSGLDLGQWIAVIFLGLGAAGAVLHRPKGAETANDKAVASVQDVVTQTAKAHEVLTQTAVDSIKAVTDAVGDLSKLLPITAQLPLPVQAPTALPDVAWARPNLGPLAQQVLGSLPKLL